MVKYHRIAAKLSDGCIKQYVLVEKIKETTRMVNDITILNLRS